MSSPRRIEPPRKNPKFPPNSPITQVVSQAGRSSLEVIAKSENAIFSREMTKSGVLT